MRKKRTHWPQSVFVGDVVKTKTGSCTLIEYKDSLSCVAQFEDGTKINCKAADFKRASIANPNFPSLCGIGYLGAPKTSEGKSPAILKWNGMIQRCYGKSPRNASYQDCSVCKEWHNFQNFKKWYLGQIGCDNKGWHLDKDIICKGNKIYSPENCAIVPPEINYFLVLRQKGRGKWPLGVIFHNGKFISQMSSNGKQVVLGQFITVEEAFSAYKTAKETEAKRLAEKYKDQIDNRVYEALLNFKIEIGD